MKLRWYEKLVIDRVKARKRALTVSASTSFGGIYQGAISNRLTADWNPINQSVDSEAHAALGVLRARSRDLARNNPYFSNFLSLIETNVAGSKGVRVQSQVRRAKGEYVKDVNEGIERIFTEWCRKGNCEVTGRLSWADVQRQFIRSVMLEGECFIRLIYRGPYGLQLQFIDPDWLDEGFTDRDENIVMSIEQDDYGRPTGYHVRPPHYDLLGRVTYRRMETTRIPAEDVLHCFIPERVNQTRGIPKCHAVMAKLNMLSGYEEAELVAARVSAAKMGFYLPPAGEAILKDESVDLLDEVEPGTLMALPEGYDFKPFDVDHPTTAFRDFTKSMLRAIASGLNMSYSTLAVDLEGVSYSSVRQGALQERDSWRVLQEWLIEHLCQPIWDRFMAINYIKLELPMRYFDQALRPAWRPRGFDWVDPQKDQNANVTAINNGLACRTDLIAEQGRDFDETVESLAYEQGRIEALGLNLGSVDKLLEIENAPDDPDKEDDEDETQPAAAKPKGNSGYVNGKGR